MVDRPKTIDAALALLERTTFATALGREALLNLDAASRAVKEAYVALAEQTSRANAAYVTVAITAVACSQKSPSAGNGLHAVQMLLLARFLLASGERQNEEPLALWHTYIPAI